MANTAELNTHSEPEGESEEYIAKMVEKVDGTKEPDPEETTEATEEEVTETEEVNPEWLPSKFKSPEELAKAYSELEKKLGSKEVKEEQSPEESESAIDFTALQSEFLDKGELSEDRMTQLEDMGIPRRIVDAYIQGQHAIVNEVQGSVYKTVGGETQYSDMMSWAKDNLSPQEVALYDTSVNSNDLDTTLYAVKGLYARYSTESGVEPTLIQGDTAPTASGLYMSAAEVKADMSNPKYQTDPAFRAKVASKLQKSNVF
jgi:hypothetical protein